MFDHVDRKELPVKVNLPHNNTTLASIRLKFWVKLFKFSITEGTKNIYLRSVSCVRGVVEQKSMTRIDGDM